MKKIFALSLLVVLAFASVIHASETKPGDVLVVLRNTSGTQIRASELSLSGSSHVSAVESFVRSSNVQLKRTYPALSEASNNIFMLVHSDTMNERELLEELRKNPNVKAAGLNHEVRIMAREPNDTFYYQQWALPAINAPEVWSSYTGSDDVYVAIIDTGIDPNHEDLDVAVEYCRNFVGYGADPDGTDEGAFIDGQSHGTHCAGIAAAVGNNSRGVSGVNWRTKIIALRALNDKGSGYNEDIVAAINHVTGLLLDNPDMKIASVNFSIGSFGDDAPEEVTGNTPYWLAFKALSDLNRAVICVAAGNETAEVGAPTQKDSIYRGSATYYKNMYCYPASFRGIENMIVVAASTSSNERASFSNYSRKYVHVAAPGYEIFSTIPSNMSEDTPLDSYRNVSPYALKSGTSMATPYVAGVAGLLKSIFPDASASEIRAAIIGSANGEYLRDDGTSMYGLIDVQGAVEFMNRSRESGSAPVFADTKLPALIVSQDYNFEFLASGTQPITFSLEGDLPEGLTFEDGILSGVPEELTSGSIIVTAENDYGSDTLVLDLNVTAGEAPVIGELTMPDAYIGELYKFTLEAESGSWPIIWDVPSTDIPESFEPNVVQDLGIIVFMPTELGHYELMVEASNDAGKDTKILSFDVKEPMKPEITDKTLKHGILGMKYGVYTSMDISIVLTGYEDAGDKIYATGIRPFSWDITAGQLPKGLKYGVQKKADAPTEENILIYGAPEELGSFDFTVTVSNKYGSDSKDFSIEVTSDAPKFVKLPDRPIPETLYLGQYGEIGIISAYGTLPMTISLVEGRLPNGIELNHGSSSVRFYGTPTESGDFPIVLEASNDSGTDRVNVLVKVVERALITDYTLPVAMKGESYNYTLRTLNDIRGKFSIDDDGTRGLPAGITLSESGVLSGVPSVSGKFNFTVTTSTDSYSLSANLLLTVLDKPAITTSSLPSGKVGTSYSETLSATGTGNIRWSVTQGTIPAGLTLASNGIIFGTPSTAGTSTFTLSAANDAGSASREFTLTVASNGDTPSPTPDPDPDPDPTPTPTPEVIINVGNPRSVSSLTAGELSAIQSSNERVIAVLPEIDVSVSDIYTFETLDCFKDIHISPDVPAGLELVWHPFIDRQDGATTEDDDSLAFFFDLNGDLTDNTTGTNLNLAVWLNDNYVYRPVISAKNSGSNVEPNRVAGSSSGGCNVGVPALIAALACVFFTRRKNG